MWRSEALWKNLLTEMIGKLIIIHLKYFSYSNWLLRFSSDISKRKPNLAISCLNIYFQSALFA